MRKIETPVTIISGTRSDIHGDALLLKEMLNEKGHVFEIEGADRGSILAHKDLDRILDELLL